VAGASASVSEDLFTSKDTRIPVSLDCAEALVTYWQMQDILNVNLLLYV